MNELLRSKQTVFSFKELILLWGNLEVKTAKSRVNYYVRKGQLYHIRRGLYGKDKNYDRYELANKIFSPSYISFETVSGAAGLTFQYYSQIFLASYQTRELICDDQKFSFKTIKDSILLDTTGIEKRESYYIASPERAFLDMIYLHPTYYFDNLSTLNWEKVYAILPIYNSRRMEKAVKVYQDEYMKSL
ncbi:MAG: hypothetical protein AAB836_00255 [Patescibacteria group bacterium]